MNPSRQAVAQAASARLIAAACRVQGKMWNRQEGLHAAAETKTEAWAAAEPLVTICASCPIPDECRYWAEVDSYTGIAAGMAWVNGKAKPARWIHRHPMKKIAS